MEEGFSYNMYKKRGLGEMQSRKTGLHGAWVRYGNDERVSDRSSTLEGSTQLTLSSCPEAHAKYLFVLCRRCLWMPPLSPPRVTRSARLSAFQSASSFSWTLHIYRRRRILTLERRALTSCHLATYEETHQTRR